MSLLPQDNLVANVCRVDVALVMKLHEFEPDARK